MLVDLFVKILKRRKTQEDAENDLTQTKQRSSVNFV